jgi:hypothetical protein
MPKRVKNQFDARLCPIKPVPKLSTAKRLARVMIRLREGSLRGSDPSCLAGRRLDARRALSAAQRHEHAQGDVASEHHLERGHLIEAKGALECRRKLAASAPRETAAVPRML